MVCGFEGVAGFAYVVGVLIVVDLSSTALALFPGCLGDGELRDGLTVQVSWRRPTIA